MWSTVSRLSQADIRDCDPPKSGNVNVEAPQKKVDVMPKRRLDNDYDSSLQKTFPEEDNRLTTRHPTERIKTDSSQARAQVNV